MTPAEHYAEAERLLERAADALRDGNTAHHTLAAAQVHATLATVPSSTTEADVLLGLIQRIVAGELGELPSDARRRVLLWLDPRVCPPHEPDGRSCLRCGAALPTF